VNVCPQSQRLGPAQTSHSAWMERVRVVFRNSPQEMIVVNMRVALRLIESMREDAPSIQRKKPMKFDLVAAACGYELNSNGNTFSSPAPTEMPIPKRREKESSQMTLRMTYVVTALALLIITGCHTTSSRYQSGCCPTPTATPCPTPCPNGQIPPPPGPIVPRP
jgi:hypothetical protein